MPEMPSLLLKGLGILLVFIGLLGTIGGGIALALVHDYDFGTPSGTFKAQVGDISASLGSKSTTLEDSLGSAKENSGEVSLALSDASGEVNQAASSIKEASGELEDAADDIDSAAFTNRQSAGYIKEASDGLKTWANLYSDADGNSLPSKSSFDSSVNKLALASDKMKETTVNLENAASDIQSTAASLDSTSQKLKDTSLSFSNAGTNMGEMGEDLDTVKDPLVSLINDLTITVGGMEQSVETVASASSGIKTIIYVTLSYLIFIHFILLLLGIALVIIEVNLFYPM